MNRITAILPLPLIMLLALRLLQRMLAELLAIHLPSPLEANPVDN